MSHLIHAVPYILAIWFVIGTVTAIIGVSLAKILPENMREDEAQRPSWFTESDRTKHLREAYVKRHDRIAIASKRERDEMLAVRK